MRFQEKICMPENKIFIDTNILVYAFDISAKEKHEIAQKILVDLWNSSLGIISTQVLQEFFIIATKKLPKPLDIKLTQEIISDLLKWDVIINDGESILEAIKIHTKYHFSFWDSMIIQAALKSDATLLFSEDLRDGQIIAHVKIKNPFDL